MHAASGVRRRRRRRKRSLATLYPAPVCFPVARTIPPFDSIGTRRVKHMKLNFVFARHSFLTSCFKYLQSMRKVHESLTPLPPPLHLLLSLSFSLVPFRSLMHLSISLCLLRPLFFVRLFFDNPLSWPSSLSLHRLSILFSLLS